MFLSKLMMNEQFKQPGEAQQEDAQAYLSAKFNHRSDDKVGNEGGLRRINTAFPSGNIQPDYSCEAKAPFIDPSESKFQHLDLAEVCDNGYNPEDVLCGRDGTTKTQPGNLLFRSLVNRHRRQYFNSSRKQRIQIADSVVKVIRDKGGRFLKIDSETGVWHELEPLKAREKAAQALRQKKLLRRLLQKEEAERKEEPQLHSSSKIVPSLATAAASQNDPSAFVAQQSDITDLARLRFPLVAGTMSSIQPALSGSVHPGQLQSSLSNNLPLLLGIGSSAHASLASTTPTNTPALTAGGSVAAAPSATQMSRTSQQRSESDQIMELARSITEANQFSAGSASIANQLGLVGSTHGEGMNMNSQLTSISSLTNQLQLLQRQNLQLQQAIAQNNSTNIADDVAQELVLSDQLQALQRNQQFLTAAGSGQQGLTAAAVGGLSSSSTDFILPSLSASTSAGVLAPAGGQHPQQGGDSSSEKPQQQLLHDQQQAQTAIREELQAIQRQLWGDSA